MSTYNLDFATCGYNMDPRLTARKQRLYCDFEPLSSTNLKPLTGATRDIIDYQALTEDIYAKFKLNVRFISDPLSGVFEIITTPTKKKKNGAFWNDNDVVNVSSDEENDKGNNSKDEEKDDNDEVDDESEHQTKENENENDNNVDEKEDVTNNDDNLEKSVGGMEQRDNVAWRENHDEYDENDDRTNMHSNYYK
jgi:hypothetical protein